MKSAKKTKRFLATLILTLLVLTGVSGATFAYETISDPDTSNSYINKLITEDDGSKNAGRLWSDKSVFSNNDRTVTLKTDTSGIDATVTTGADFLHEYSLLSSSQILNEEAPLDVMFILDISLSMSDTTGTPTPANRQTVQALNKSINTLLSTNPNARIGVAVFSSKGTLVVPLGAYEPSDNGFGSTQFATLKNYPGSQDFFSIEFNYKDKEGNIYKKTASNYDNDPELKEETWKGVVVQDEGNTYIVNGGSTNIQSGFKAGLKELADQIDTTVISEFGNTISRIPVMILLTDGAANTMASIEDINVIENGYITNQDQQFYDQDGAIGEGSYDFINFDTTKDLAHANDFFGIYGNDGDYGDLGDSTVSSAINILTESKKSALAMSEYETYDPIILNTLLTASYYTSAVNNTYQNNALSKSASNMTNIKLQNYVIFTATNGRLFSSNEYNFITSKVINPEENFIPSSELSEDANLGTPTDSSDALIRNRDDAYNLYKAWLVDGQSKVTDKIVTEYSLGDISNQVSYDYFIDWVMGNTDKPAIKKYFDSLASYDPTVDGDYDTFENDLYYDCLNQYSLDETGYPIDIRTTITTTLSDEWFENQDNNPYNVSKDALRDNINYLPSKNCMAITNDQIENTFSNIISELTGKAFISVKGKNSLGIEDSITYMDPMGQYMEIKNDISYGENGSENQAEMALLINGNINSYVKTAVYDYKFNNTYVANHPEIASFQEGWYKGDDPEGEVFYKDPDSGIFWDEGYVYRVRFNTAIAFVPTLFEQVSSAEDLTDKQKNTVYTFYRASSNTDERRAWRVNPSYITSIDFIDESKIDPETFIIKDDEVKAKLDDLESKGNVPDGVYKLSDIRIWIEDTGDYKDDNPEGSLFPGLNYDQALYVNIPSSAVPTQVAEITASKADGIDYIDNLDKKIQSTPLRLFYAVGVKDDIKIDDGDTIDLSKVDKNYLDTHTREADGKVFFYSNQYSKNTYDEYIDVEGSRTRGDPVVTFSPEITNKYYVYQHFHILYSKLHQVQNGGLVEVAKEGLPLDFEEKLKFKALTTSDANDLINSGKLTENDYVILSDSVTDHYTENTNYFVILSYFTKDGEEGKGKESYSVSIRNGKVFTLSQFSNIKESDLLCWYKPDPDNTETSYVEYTGPNGPTGYALSTKPGGIRLGDMGQTIDSKEGDYYDANYRTGNLTQTANNYFVPTLASNSGTNNNILNNSYLGNDGLVLAENTLFYVTKLVANDQNEFVGSNVPMSYKEFDYQVYIEGFNGTRSAIKVQWDDGLELWRRRIATIDVITDNNGLLQYEDLSLVRADSTGKVLDETSNLSPDQTYFIYVKPQNVDPDEEIMSSDVVRVYSATDYDGDQNSYGNRVITDSGVNFNANEVYLIPYREIENNPLNWKFDEKLYNEVENFTIAQMLATEYDNRTNGLDIQSPYAIRSSYLTVDINFGTNVSELFDQTPISVSENNRTRTITVENIAKNTAQFKLHHGEGLLFNSIASGSIVRSSEKLDQANDLGWKLWDKKEELTKETIGSTLKVAVKNLKQDYIVAYDANADYLGGYTTDEETIYNKDQIAGINPIKGFVKTKSTNGSDVYSVYGRSGSKEEGVQYLNTGETEDLVIEKALEPSDLTDINDSDKEQYFTYDLSLSYPEGFIPKIDNEVRYKYAILSNDSNGSKTGYLVKQESAQTANDNNILAKSVEDNKLTWEISFSSNQTFVIYDLLVGTEYTIVEQNSPGFTEKTENIPHSGSIKTIENDTEVSNKVTITNVKLNPRDTYINLVGSKKITSAVEGAQIPELKGRDFKFIITRGENNPESDPLKDEDSIIASNDSKGNIVFFDENTRFNAPGTYIYYLTEDDNDSTTINKDPRSYEVVVTIEEEYDQAGHYTGDLKASYQLYENNDTKTEVPEVAFENSYTPEPLTDFAITGTKTHKYNSDNANNNLPKLSRSGFTFTITPSIGSPAPADLKTTSDPNGEFKFGPITFNRPGTYRYRITESVTDSKFDHTDYDDSIYYVTVVVSDENGKLVANQTTYKKYIDANNPIDVDTLTFTNTYRTGDLVVRKTLDVANPDTSKEFTFEIETDNPDIKGKFGDITFDAGKATVSVHHKETKKAEGLPEGTKFSVREINSEDYHVGYSNDNIGVIQQSSVSTVTIINSEPISVPITGKKVLTDAQGNEINLDNREFTFILEPNKNNPDYTLETVPLEIKNNADGSFGLDLKYTEPGLYIYNLKEKIDEDLSDIIFDRSVYTIRINVFENAQGKLEYSKTISKVSSGTTNNVDNIIFTNFFNPAKPTSLVIEGEKTFKTSKGKEGKLNGNDFEFELVALEETTQSETGQTWTTKNDSNGHFAFEPLTFTSEGTYYYRVKEIEKETSPYLVDFDENIFTVKIEVTKDDNSHKLKATSAYYLNNSVGSEQSVEELEFKNTLLVGDLKVKKEVYGSKTDKSRYFGFQIKLFTDEAKSTTAESINGKYGDITFVNGISNTFYLSDYQSVSAKGLPVGLYFEVTETLTNNFIPTITSDNNGKGIIKNGYQEVNFLNKNPDITPVSYKIKVLKGIENTDRTDPFKFQLISENPTLDGFTLPDITEITINGSGENSFGTIRFTKEGTYTFKVSEIDLPANYQVISSSDQQITIVVNLDEPTRSLKIKSVDISNGPEANNLDEVTFINRYLGPEELVIQGQKNIIDTDGNKVNIPDGFMPRFKFVLEQDPDFENPDNDPLKGHPFVTTNDSNGNFKFANIQYFEVGTYQYILHEFEEPQSNSNNGYINDKTQYKVEVNVATNSDNKLSASQTIYKVIENAEDEVLTDSLPVFENMYSPNEANFILNGKKIFEGGKLNGDDFTFVLAPKEGNPDIEEHLAQNNQEGNFSFNLTFAKTGTYLYTLYERNGDNPSISYTSRVYDVKVEVKALDIINLIPIVTVTRNGNPVDLNNIVFTNRQNVGSLEISKEVQGSQEDKANKFNFTVSLFKDAEHSISADLNGVYGDLTFENGFAHIELKHGDIVKADNIPANLYYFVEEDPINDFDANFDHQYGRIVTNSTEKVHFINVKKEKTPTEYSLQVLKNVVIATEEEETSYQIYDEVNDSFTFSLDYLGVDLEGVTPPENKIITVKGNRTGEFDKITFKREGSYKFVVTEVDIPNYYRVENRQYFVTFNIGVEESTQALKIDSVEINDIAQENFEGLNFTNIYLNPVETSVTGNKALIDQEGNPIDNRAGFKFILTPHRHNSMYDPVSADGMIVQTDEEGNFSFDPLEYDRPGHYVYTVKEIYEGFNYIYDSSTYTVDILVFNDGQSDSLQLIKTVTNDSTGETVELVSFNNIYHPEKTSAVIEGTKIFENYSLVGNDFTFKLESLDENSEFSPIYSQNNKAGHFTFDAIVFDTQGVYHYCVSEVKGDQNNIIYSDLAYMVTVKVDLNEEGHIYSSVEYLLDDSLVDEIIFTNIQETTNLAISKTVDGTLDDQEREFNFTVNLYSDEEYSNVAEEVTGDYGDLTFVNGVAEFTLHNEEIKVADGLPLGLYYEVNEESTEDFDITVTGEKGQLQKNTKAEADFVNTRNSIIPVSYPINVKKNIKGINQSEDTFTFTLDLINGNKDNVILPVSQKINIKGEGVQNFDEIQFTAAGTYTFEVKEIDIPSNYEVDKVDHTVTIEITEENKTLYVNSVLVDSDDSEVVFTNTYSENTPVISKPNVGIVKLHSFDSGSYHNNINEISEDSTVWYLLRIVNNGSDTIHNLVIYDSIPETMDLADQAFISQGPINEEHYKQPIFITSSYYGDLNLLKLAKINNKSFDLAPGEEINLEYRVQVPHTISEETNWTNHAWIYYDELDYEATLNKDNISSLNLFDSANALSFENLMNYDKIDIPIEMEPVSDNKLDNHSRLHNSESISYLIDSDHVKYSNDVREHIKLSSTNDPIPPDDPKDPQEDPPVVDKDPGNSSPNGSTSGVQTGKPNGTSITSTTTTNTVTNQNSLTKTNNSPKTGLEGNYFVFILVGLIILAIVVVVVNLTKKKK